jgi:8-oxo-dGTP pyrophosphatase MutT (NUDIX family)
MKIFLEDRIIRISHKPAKGDSPGSVILEYSSPKKLSRSLEDFEKQTSKQELQIWSSDNFGKLKKAFLSLFEVIEAAGGVVKNEKDELLVIFRFGRWDLPKGKIHLAWKNDAELLKESNETAAIREVMEETGLTKVTITGKLRPSYHIYYKDNKRFLKKTVWFSMIAGSNQNLVPQGEEDITIVKWAPKEELPMLMGQTYSSLKKYFRSSEKRT